MAQQTDAEAMAVTAGCIAEEINESEGVWTQIGANWAVSRHLLAEAEAHA